MSKWILSGNKKDQNYFISLLPLSYRTRIQFVLIYGTFPSFGKKAGKQGEKKMKKSWFLGCVMAMVVVVGLGYWYLRPAAGPAVPEGLSRETVATLGEDFLRDRNNSKKPSFGPIHDMKYECFVPLRFSEIASAGKSMHGPGRSSSSQRNDALKNIVAPCYRLAYRVHFSNRRNDLGPGEVQLIIGMVEGEPVVLKTIVYDKQQSYWPSLAGSSKPKD